MILPIVPEDVFEINSSHRVRYDEQLKVVIVDNWYKNLSEIQNVLSNLPAVRWKWTENSRNFVDYYDCRPIIPFHYETDKAYRTADKVANILFDYFNAFEVELENNLYEFNFYKNIRTPANNLQANPHTDNSFNCIIYLDNICSGGTALYDMPPIDNTEDENLLIDVSNFPKRIIEAKPNRLVLFDGRILHGAYIKNHEEYVNDWRMNQIMFFRKIHV